ncbi:hypothetical protein HY631_00330 [Candidatus Uhrbacteria bacterium]|nr:hypothetical protein [Candidatus Uhrbacteria bacterium]
MHRILSIHIQRFRLGTMTLLLATGSASDIASHVRDEIVNKVNLVSGGVRQDGARAMVLYVEDTGDTDKAKATAISSDLVKAILNGYNQDTWTFFSAFVSLKDGIQAAIGSSSIKDQDAVQSFAKDFGRAIFQDDGLMDGTKTLFLFAPDSDRYVMAFKGNGKTILAQPYGPNLTRYTFAGANLVAARALTGDIATMSFKKIEAKLEDKKGEGTDWDKTSLGSVQIDDLSLGNLIGKSAWTIVVSGKFGNMQALQTLTVTKDGDSLQITRHPPIGVDDMVASYGSPIRSDGTSVTFVNRNGGANSVTRVPLSSLPSKVKSAFTHGATV